MISIRPAVVEDCPELARILVEANDDAFRGLVPDYCLESLTITESAINWRRNFAPGGSLEKGEYLIVAIKGHEKVIGFAMGGRRTGRRDYPVELSVLMVDPPWQRQGVGRMLVREIVQIAMLAGFESLLVGVLKENPNRLFYERLGARQIGQKPYSWSGYVTAEILYAWDDFPLILSDVPR